MVIVKVEKIPSEFVLTNTPNRCGVGRTSIVNVPSIRSVASHEHRIVGGVNDEEIRILVIHNVAEFIVWTSKFVQFEIIQYQFIGLAQAEKSCSELPTFGHGHAVVGQATQSNRIGRRIITGGDGIELLEIRVGLIGTSYPRTVPVSILVGVEVGVVRVSRVKGEPREFCVRAGEGSTCTVLRQGKTRIRVRIARATRRNINPHHTNVEVRTEVVVVLVPGHLVLVPIGQHVAVGVVIAWV